MRVMILTQREREWIQASAPWHDDGTGWIDGASILSKIDKLEIALHMMGVIWPPNPDAESAREKQHR